MSRTSIEEAAKNCRSLDFLCAIARKVKKDEYQERNEEALVGAAMRLVQGCDHLIMVAKSLPFPSGKNLLVTKYLKKNGIRSKEEMDKIYPLIQSDGSLGYQAITALQEALQKLSWPLVNDEMELAFENGIAVLKLGKEISKLVRHNMESGKDFNVTLYIKAGGCVTGMVQKETLAEPSTTKTALAKDNSELPPLSIYEQIEELCRKSASNEFLREDDRRFVETARKLLRNGDHKDKSYLEWTEEVLDESGASEEYRNLVLNYAAAKERNSMPAS